MRKHSKKIFSHRLIRGYGYISLDVPSEKDILDELIEFSKTKKDIQIYKHLIRKEWYPNKKYKPLEVDGVKIPRGNEIWYLDIYYQEKGKESTDKATIFNPKHLMVPDKLAKQAKKLLKVIKVKKMKEKSIYDMSVREIIQKINELNAMCGSVFKFLEQHENEFVAVGQWLCGADCDPDCFFSDKVRIGVAKTPKLALIRLYFKVKFRREDIKKALEDVKKNN